MDGVKYKFFTVNRNWRCSRVPIRLSAGTGGFHEFLLDFLQELAAFTRSCNTCWPAERTCVESYTTGKLKELKPKHHIIDDFCLFIDVMGVQRNIEFDLRFGT